MVRAIVITALVAAVASGLQLGNPVGSNLARRTAARQDDVVATDAPEPEPTSFEEGEQGARDSVETGGLLPPAKANKANKTGARQAQTQQTGAPRGGDSSFSDDMPAEDADRTGVPNVQLPTRTGLSGNNSPIETGYPEDGFDADQTGFPEDGPAERTGNPPGVAAPTAGSNARSTETPVLISEGRPRPVGQVTVLLGFGAVALAIGLS